MTATAIAGSSGRGRADGAERLSVIWKTSNDWVIWVAAAKRSVPRIQPGLARGTLRFAPATQITHS